MKYNIKLTLKSIIRTEQMLGKPFNDLDYTNENDVLTLLYCSILSNNKKRMTFDAFKLIASNDKQYKTIISEFENESKVIAQFNKKEEESGSTAKSDAPRQYMSELAGTLIMAGVSAEYVLNEMELSDLPFIVKSYEAKKKEKMESDRMWTYYSILPHINSKKIKHPSDIVAFPWEQEQKEREGKALLEACEEEFMRFMNGEYNHFIKN